MEAPRQIEVRPEAKELELGLTPERMGRLAPLAELQIRDRKSDRRLHHL
jgi:hypothetical protein